MPERRPTRASRRQVDAALVETPADRGGVGARLDRVDRHPGDGAPCGVRQGGERGRAAASAAPVPSSHGLLPGRRQPAWIPRRPHRTAQSLRERSASSRSAGRPRSGSARPPTKTPTLSSYRPCSGSAIPTSPSRYRMPAVPGTRPAHLLIDYQLRVRQFEPDLIVVFEAINDLYRSFSPPWWAVGEFRPDYSHYLGPYIRFPGPRRGAARIRFLGGLSRICSSGGGSGKTCSANLHRTGSMPPISGSCAPACAHGR